MKLLTQTIKKKLPKLYETENVPNNRKNVICRFFNPIGHGDWYVLEGEEREDDFIFFGLVHLHEKELGYFSLKELQSTRLPFGMKIERDLLFEGCSLNEIYF